MRPADLRVGVVGRRGQVQRRDDLPPEQGGKALLRRLARPRARPPCTRCSSSGRRCRAGRTAAAERRNRPRCGARTRTQGPSRGACSPRGTSPVAPRILRPGRGSAAGSRTMSFAVDHPARVVQELAERDAVAVGEQDREASARPCRRATASSPGRAGARAPPSTSCRRSRAASARRDACALPMRRRRGPPSRSRCRAGPTRTPSRRERSASARSRASRARPGAARPARASSRSASCRDSRRRAPRRPPPRRARPTRFPCRRISLQ